MYSLSVDFSPSPFRERAGERVGEKAALDPATYRPHALHDTGRIWPETNCYTDLVIELVHGLGHEPTAMLPFTLTVDFEGDQWTFFKPPAADLDALYGLDVQELAIWRPMAEHVAEQVALGRPVLVEVDSYFLPDTVGTAYKRAHVKTTIGIDTIDIAARRLGYFHNAGYHALEGEDFAAALQLAGPPHERVLPPYVEVVKRRPGFAPLSGERLTLASVALLRAHARRIPPSNPFPAFKARFERDLQWLQGSPLEAFHAYSFANLRQYGACFELAASYLQWISQRGGGAFATAAMELLGIATTAKNLQFQLARSMARGKALDLTPIDAMAAAWQRAMDEVRARLA